MDGGGLSVAIAESFEFGEYVVEGRSVTDDFVLGAYDFVLGAYDFVLKLPGNSEYDLLRM